jgi:hypothetical protein
MIAWSAPTLSTPEVMVARLGRSVAPAENTTSPPGGTCRKWGLGIGCKELARTRALSTGLSIAYL